MVPMSESLSGKWVWVWNWRRSDGGDPERVAGRLLAAGCRGALVKAFDGPRWFDQGEPWREIARALRARGLLVGGWGYCYGEDPAGEARRAAETAGYGEADLLVLDVEGEFKGRPQAAEELCRRLREAVGPAYPLYYSSFAIVRYHRAFPYEVFRRYCSGAVPQVYWNAFRWTAARALAETYEGYLSVGEGPERLCPAGGLYQGGGVQYPTGESVLFFAAEAARRGSPGVSFWSYEHMDEAMWRAVREAAVDDGAAAAQAMAEVRRSLRELGARVERLEAEVQALRRRLPPGPGRRTYTVRPGDTLAGIAAALGLGDWRSLYEANREVIGPDPDVIRPGQVLVLP